jgi:acid stress-induced BolA-like protein IbaG/YrbA
LYPIQAFAALEHLAAESGNVDPVIALAGQFRAKSHISYRNSVYLGVIPYSQMAALHSVTLANLTNESLLNHCLGNQKVIDSVSLGIPVLCKRLDTFVEQLGSDYPCFYETELEAYQIAKKLMTEKAFLESVRRMSLIRAQHFRRESVRDQFLAQPELLQLC